MSVREPSARWNATASPRTSGAKSGTVGSPLPFENLTVARTGSPAMWPARVRAAASGVAVNDPLQSTPFACRARRLGCDPNLAPIASSASSGVVTAPAYALACRYARVRARWRRLMTASATVPIPSATAVSP